MSGRVRTQFALRGWDAWSCDLLPDETEMWNKIPGDLAPPGHHYQGDVLKIIEDDWDLIVAHPPCTDLTYAGARWFKQKRADGSQQASAEFFRKLYDYPRPEAFVVLENPMGIMSREDMFRPHDQEVEPYWFGDPLRKKTCLWFRPAVFTGGFHGSVTRKYTLPPLLADNMVVPTGRVTTGGGSWRTDKAAGLTGMNQNWEDSQGRARRQILRSLTPEGFARAVASQWGSWLEEFPALR